jgi:GTP-binding protein LepA
MNNIRNFVIIAHIDAGKSTLADRLLELTGTVDKRNMVPQYLDKMELERERGITIKMAPVRMLWHPPSANNESITNKRIRKFESNSIFADEYMLNLIDTPGHSDFSYEVSRALNAVEGAILLIDGTRGVQAQTLSNLRLARKAGLKIIGAVNKIDLDLPQINKVIKSAADLLDMEEKEIFRVSAKTGEGVRELLEAVISKCPPPLINADKKLIDADNISTHQLNRHASAMPARALIFDSLYDDHKGIIAFVRVFNGSFNGGEEVELIASGAGFKIKEVGYFAPELKTVTELSDGEIGYVATGLKEPALVRIGDTLSATAGVKPLLGYREPTPVVFISFYPDGVTKFEDLKRALERLRLNDAALSFEPDANEALGRGLKVGFLGQLHFEITASRLEREFNLEFLTSFPSIAYRVLLSNTADQRGLDADVRGTDVEQCGTDADARGNGQRKSASSQRKSALGQRKSALSPRESATIVVKQPQDFPDKPEMVWQPMIKLEILAPSVYLNQIVNLKNIFDLKILEVKNLGENLIIAARMPLAELIRDFDDRLKSVSAGFASFSYELDGEAEAEVEKLEILVAEEVVPALTRIVPKKDVEREGRATVERLKELLPRQQFAQAVQARALGRIIARETIPALRKDVTGYLYGGDRSRKMKLWKKQQRGKKKLKEMAKVRLSPEVFREILKK